PSGVRSISGVATSNGAIVGPAQRGPVNEAVRLTSFGEFERVFGGLFAPSEATYAVRNFFLNGGSVLFFVRVADGTAAASTINTLGPAVGDLTVTASSEGAWGDNLRVAIARAPDADTPTSFNMLVREYEGTTVLREEAFIDLSITEGDARYVETVVEQESELITAAHVTATLPNASDLDGAGTLARTLDDLLEAPVTAFTALAAGADGAVPGAAGWPAAMQNLMVGSEANGTGIFALNGIVPEVFNIMMMPDAAGLDRTDGNQRDAMVAVYQQAYTYCRQNFAFLIIDPTNDLTRANFTEWRDELGVAAGPNSAMYFPRVTGADPLNPLQPRIMRPSGIAAGVFARTDTTRGVWKAPAGTEARIAGGTPVDVMTNRQQGPLNTQGVNALRTFPVYNSVIWGGRTLDGADARASEWRYVNVRRLALFIENSLNQGLQWVVFEPNDEPLWANVRLNVGAFMSQLHRQGAFQGASARDAYLVKCDSETTTQADINLGILNIYVGFAPVRPAEFVVLRIQQRFQTAA
ncbi:MAG: phage tail sheath C-terminal domain-containing protein, partial [Pseudomonadota bacterium]